MVDLPLVQIRSMSVHDSILPVPRFTRGSTRRDEMQVEHCQLSQKAGDL